MPNEIYNEVYDTRTEIFYVGYLIKNLIAKYSIDCFKYTTLLEEMTAIDPIKRIQSFEYLKQKLVEQTFETFDFSAQQKDIYQCFANAMCNLLSRIIDSLTVERDTATIIENLRILLRDNSLEEYISHPDKLISCFVKSNFKYYRKSVDVNIVQEFYDFFIAQSPSYQNIVLNNLYGRLSNIEVIDTTIDPDLPFN